MSTLTPIARWTTGRRTRTRATATSDDDVDERPSRIRLIQVAGLLTLRLPSCRISNDPRAGSTDTSGPASPTDANSRTVGIDRDLVEAAQHGDQEAFVDLVRLHGDRLYAIPDRILRDVDRAEDALQDALVIAWRDLPSLRDPDRFGGWIYRVLTNVCISQATRERRRIASLRVLPVDEGVSRQTTSSALPIGTNSTARSVAYRLTSAASWFSITSLATPVRDCRTPRPAGRDGSLTTPSRASRMRAALNAKIQGSCRRRVQRMNERGDISPALQHWFADGPTTMPDQVINVVAESDRSRAATPWLATPLGATAEGQRRTSGCRGGRTVGRRVGRSSLDRWFVAIRSAHSTGRPTGRLGHADHRSRPARHPRRLSGPA